MLINSQVDIRRIRLQSNQYKRDEGDNNDAKEFIAIATKMGAEVKMYKILGLKK